MMFKVVGTFKSALSRQIFEAVRIRRRGTAVLNSRGEYNRSRIHRLTINKEEEQSNWGEQDSSGTERESMEFGERCLMDRRKQMDREKTSTTGTGTQLNKGQKRGNTEYVDDKRKTKKRKFALVGEQWGSKKGASGLECRLEQKEAGCYSSTSPLVDPGPGQEGSNQVLVEMEREEIIQGGTIYHRKPVEEEIINNTDGGTERYSSAGPLLDQLSEHGPSIGVNNDVVVEGEQNDRGEQDQVGTKPCTITSSKGGGGTKDVINNDEIDNLYDTAATLMRLREDRGTCNVRKGWCQEHNLKARKVTSTKKVWTKMKRTGLYQYCSRKMSVWRCDVTMGTLVSTMRPGDSAGGKTGSGSEKCSENTLTEDNTRQI